MASCSSSEILTLGSVRTYLQVPDPKSCTRKTLFYGKDCQLMEVEGVTRNVRTAGTPIRTWSRRKRTYCTIANTEAPPDNPEITLRFYEACGRGLPLPHTLGECRVRVVNNYGLCKSNGTIANGWSSYAEVLDARILSEGRGRRSSYDGADDALVDEITAELLNVFDISTIQFSQVDLSNLTCTTGNGGVFNSAVFGCFTGCGGRACDCAESCDDGTYTFYVPSSCTGGTSQFVIFTSDGGSTVNTSLLPATTGGGMATLNPVAAVIGNTLYVLAYQNPTELYSIDLDEYGTPTGSWQLVATLTGTDSLGATITTGTPGALAVDGDTLHILVNDTVAGSRTYTLGGNLSPSDGERFTFPIAAGIHDLKVCGDIQVASGLLNNIYMSEDEGDSWATVTAPTALQAVPVDIQSINYVDGRIWIGAAAGGVYYTSDGTGSTGSSWSKINIATLSGNVTDIGFVGDDVGWIIDSSGRPTSTWIGGLQTEEWTRDVTRVYGWPSTVTPVSVALPHCASSTLAANTLLVIGTDAGGNSVAYMGRATLTGV